VDLVKAIPVQQNEQCIARSLATYGIPLPDIIDETLEGIIGGTEAVGHALTNVTFHLAKEKQVVAKLRKELADGCFRPEVPPSAVLSKFQYLVRQFHKSAQPLLKLVECCSQRRSSNRTRELLPLCQSLSQRCHI
jgi:hypothetical protein